VADPLREQLAHLLEWKEAHAGFDKAVDGMPFELQGKVPASLEHSAWQLLEHIRLAQEDILDFTVNANYAHKQWPDDYWPRNPAPPDASAWERSVAACRAGRAKMQALTRDPKIDLFAKIPHGDGQTYIREILLVADHGSYHVGQIVLVRRALGHWA
jgi:uncharacterized damage-inducible protein DinB